MAGILFIPILCFFILHRENELHDLNMLKNRQNLVLQHIQSAVLKMVYKTVRKTIKQSFNTRKEHKEFKDHKNQDVLLS